MQAFGLSCQGGLNTNLNQFQMLQQPGFATELVNFEVDPDGGYRRVSGFTPFGGDSATRPNSSNRVLGTFTYGDGVIVCSGTDIFFSNDGISWLQINRSSVANSGDNYTTFTGRSTLTRSGQTQCQFVLFEGATFDYGEVIIADGVNKLYSFRMEGTGALSTRTFFASQITVDGSNGVKYITIHDHHLIASGVANNLNTIYYSVYNDPDNFTGSGAGSVTISDQVQGIKGFRTDLIVFAKNSIHKLININDSANVRIDPIAENVGCLSGYSIQEIGGDLVFLAPDGLRTIAGTARIGDVELSSISRKILPLINTLLDNISSYNIDSMVIRERSQYRLFYYQSGQAASSQKGIIGTFKFDANGVPSFEWSETKGLPVKFCTSDVNNNGTETLFHTDETGYVYQHDTGNSFDGLNIDAQFQTPDMDYGDNGLRKSLYAVKANIEPEGTNNNLKLRIRYDFESTEVPQPGDFTVGNLSSAAVFGSSSAVFGTSVFGAVVLPSKRMIVTGSGFSNNFRFFTDDTDASYSVNGMFVSFIAGGRR